MAMIVLLLISVIFNLSDLRASENTLQQNSDFILEAIGIEKMHKDILKVKNYPNISYADEINHEIKKFKDYWPFWKRFNSSRYLSEFIEKVQVTFKEDELVEIEKLLKKPFIPKILKSLINYSVFLKSYNDLLIGEQFSLFITDQRKDLMGKMYKYLGLEILDKNLFLRLSRMAQMEAQSIKVVQLLKGRNFYLPPDTFDVYKKNIKRLIYYNLTVNLYRISDHELTVFLTKVNNRSSRKFIQFFVNYHYLTLLDLLLDNEQELGMIEYINAR